MGKIKVFNYFLVDTINKTALKKELKTIHGSLGLIGFALILSSVVDFLNDRDIRELDAKVTNLEIELEKMKKSSEPTEEEKKEE